MYKRQVPNSDQPLRVPPGRAPDQLGNVLEALALVTEFATGGIDAMLLRESPHLPWAATLVLVTAVVTDDILIALTRLHEACLLYTSPSPRDRTRSRMPSSA